MKKDKRAKLEAHDWRVGSAAEFLKLTQHDAAIVEVKARVKSIRSPGSGRQTKVTDPASHR